MSTIKQGDLFTYDFGERADHRQAGKRPVVVLQTDALNRVEGYGLTLVAPLTTNGRPSPSHVSVEPSAENGLAQISFVKTEQVYTLPAADLLSKLGSLSDADLFKVKQALAIVFDLRTAHL